MEGAFGRRTGIRWKKTGRKTNVSVFCCFGLILFGRTLITRHTGVVTAQTQHKALLIHAPGQFRALEVGPDPQAVHFRCLCVLKRIAPPPHHLNGNIIYFLSERKHRVLKDEKKDATKTASSF